MSMKSVPTVLFFMSLAACSALAFAGSDRFAGNYTCKGSNPLEKVANFTDTFTVTLQKKNTYTGVSTDTDGSLYPMIALSSGNDLYVAFTKPKNADFGVEHFKLKGKKLMGTFSYHATPTVVGTETCIKK